MKVRIINSEHRKLADDLRNDLLMEWEDACGKGATFCLVQGCNENSKLFATKISDELDQSGIVPMCKHHASLHTSVELEIYAYVMPLDDRQ
jgi:hypothetical protein